ncbi:protein PTCD3 homolog, mitochondrial [Orussus abietinus]|uniref:protein PTCD3 homolog, mitochondrial n=1 Tax=Orussus abietinus TaxID=222816 RepID=UPI0006253FDF|nr:protein PTCD3 homolog, mitochondrial [Orussus abietinus]
MNLLNGWLINRNAVFRMIVRLQSTATSTSASPNPEIVIPHKKERGPTDILRALSHTISHDSTAAHYKFHDDPYFTPLSINSKRRYALAKESGRKAAMWILQEHADLFQHRLSEPKIEAFAPRAVYDNKNDATEDALLSAINHGRVTDAIKIYELLEGEISTTGKQALLELLCFYNSTDPQSNELHEERWFQYAQKNVVLWKDNEIIQQLFTFLKRQEETRALAYNTLISGTAKYLQVMTTWDLYAECKEKNIPLSITTYNYLIATIPNFKYIMEERKELLWEMLKEINTNGIKPNVRTLNAALKVVTAASTTYSQKLSKDLVRKLLTEFKNIGIKPSLASYYYVLQAFYQPKGTISNILVEIIKEARTQDLTPQDPQDILFFSTAMKVAKEYFQDRSITASIHDLLMKDDNYNFIGNAGMEGSYYRNYMNSLLVTETFERFMEIYNTLVPTIYIPESSVFTNILNAVQSNSPDIGQSLIPLLWSHMVMFNFLDRDTLVLQILRLMSVECRPEKTSPLNQQFAEIAWTVWTYFQEKNSKLLQTINWPIAVFACVTQLLIRGDQFEKMIELIAYVTTEESITTGTLPDDAFEEMLLTCINEGYIKECFLLLEYAVKVGYDNTNMLAKKICHTLPLNSTEKNKLINWFGKDIFEISHTLI